MPNTEINLFAMCKIRIGGGENAGQAGKKSKTIVTYYGAVIALKMQISGSHSDRGSDSLRNCVETEAAECPCVSYRIRHRINTHTPANNNFVLLFYAAFVVLY